MILYEPDPVGPFDAPVTIELIDGEVVFIGPGPIAFSMTVQAAMETSRRLVEVLAERPLKSVEAPI